MQFNILSCKYSSTNKTVGFSKYDNMKSTEKWLEYTLDIIDMQSEMMQSKDFTIKYELAQMLIIAERKKTYMYKHKNFDLKRATFLLSSVRNVAKKQQQRSVPK